MTSMYRYLKGCLEEMIRSDSIMGSPLEGRRSSTLSRMLDRAILQY